MRKVILAGLILIVCNATTLAQTSDERRGWGYGFAGFGAFADDGAIPLYHVGGGGERLLYRGLGAGAEIGYIAPAGAGGDGVGLFSSNLSYHFRSSNNLSPFVTGGYSVGFRRSAANGGNFGGGLQYWVGERVGLRLEFRDQIFSSDSPHTVSFRVGVSFR